MALLLVRVSHLIIKSECLHMGRMIASCCHSGGSADQKTDDSYQIDFLNSVIVDQKMKIDELNNKVKVLAEVGVNHNGFGDEDMR